MIAREDSCIQHLIDNGLNVFFIEDVRDEFFNQFNVNIPIFIVLLLLYYYYTTNLPQQIFTHIGFDDVVVGCK